VKLELEEMETDPATDSASGAIHASRLSGFIISGLALVILAVAVTWLLARPPAGSAPPTFTQLTDQPGAELYTSLSPDGKSFVYQGKAADRWDIFFQRVGGKNPVNLTKDSSTDNTQPAFSPDGQRIAFRSERDGGGIFIMGATGEDVKRLTDFGYNPAWSPDGSEIVCSTAWFPFANSRLGNVQSKLFRISVSTGGEAVAVTNDDDIDWNPVWSPDGKYLYFSSDRGGSMNLWRVRIDEKSGKLLGSPEPVTTPSLDSGFMSFSPDGKRLLYVQQTMSFELYKVGFDPSRETVVGQPLLMSHGPQRPTLSPDSRSLAYFGLHGKQEDIFVTGVDGKGLRQLTDDIYKDRQPRWSPDGKRIAFHSNRSGNWQIWTIYPDGSGLAQLTYEPGGGGVNNPVWSPDGSRIAYGIKDVNSFIIDVKKPWSAQSPQPLVRPSGLDAYLQVNSWSPDGRELAGDVQILGGFAGIGVYSFERHEVRRLTQMGRNPWWLSDSRRLLFVHSGKLYLVDSQSGRVRELLAMAPREAVIGVASRDDRWIYLSVQATEADVWQMSFGLY
jgi:Tol biopolymer transport system component